MEEVGNVGYVVIKKGGKRGMSRYIKNIVRLVIWLIFEWFICIHFESMKPLWLMLICFFEDMLEREQEDGYKSDKQEE